MKLGKKGLNPRYPVLKEVYLYDDVMGPLLSHLRAHNSMEISAIRSSAMHAANAVFERVKKRIKPVASTEPLDVKLRHNDSVSFLRAKHIKTINKICKSKFGYNL